MLSLDALANWETAVLASIRGATGTIDERDAQITRSGMYAEYPAIFQSYLELAWPSDEGNRTSLEALKRVVFLAWYSFVELPVISGIAELPETAVREAMDALNRTLAAEQGDDELRWMLAWYREGFGYVFEYFGSIRELESFVAGTSGDDARTELEAGRFAGRGQMGAYWNAVLNGR